MKKIKYIAFLFAVFFIIIGNVFAEDTGANGQGAGLGLTQRDTQQCDSVASEQWIYKTSYWGYQQMGDFNMDTGSREELFSPDIGPELKDETSWRHCCEVGNAIAEGIIWACDLYDINPDYLANQSEDENTNENENSSEEENTISGNNTLSEADQKDPNKAISCGYITDNYVFDYNFVKEGKQKDMYDDNKVICCNPSYEENGKTYTQCTRYVSQSLVDAGYETKTDVDNREDLEDLRGDLDANCDSMFDSEAQELIQRLFNIICIAVPILLIVLGSVDFGNAVLSSDQEAMQKAVKRFTTRCIIAVAIFFLPLIVNLLFSFPGLDIVAEEFFCDV